MALRIPKTIDAVTGFLSLGAFAGSVLSIVSLIAYLTQPDRISEPIKLWIIPAVTIIYIAGTIWSYRMDQQRLLTKATTTKQAGPTDGRVSRTKAKKAQEQETLKSLTSNLFINNFAFQKIYAKMNLSLRQAGRG